MSVRWAVIPRGNDVRDPGQWEAIAALVGADSLAVMTAEHGIGQHHADAHGVQPPADILSTRVPGLAVAAVAADCVPVVLDAGDEVVVVHAGWRGVLAGAVTEARQGRNVASAIVGPSICAGCYEVSAELAADFATALPAAVAGPRHLDLAAGVVSQLAGIRTQVIPRCTLEDEGLYSFRGGDEVARGGLVAVLA